MRISVEKVHGEEILVKTEDGREAARFEVDLLLEVLDSDGMRAFEGRFKGEAAVLDEHRMRWNTGACARSRSVLALHRPQVQRGFKV